MGKAGSKSGSRETALQALSTRREDAQRKGQIDNSSLRAGQPMYYYCRLCGLLACTMREEWDPRFESIKTHCDPCQRALDAGDLTSDD